MSLVLPSLPIASIIVERRFRKQLGNLDSLIRSIAEVGLLHPIVVRPDKRLIAGVRRLEACRSLGWKTVPVYVIDPLNLLWAERDENGIRLDLLPSEQVAIARACEQEEQKRAKERQMAPLKKGKKAPVSENFANGEKGRTCDRIASGLGVSGRTLEKEIAVVEAAEKDPEKFGPLAEQMDATGKVNTAYRRMRRAKASAAFGTAALPTQEGGNTYDVILADPPWRYEHSESDARAIENQYPTMPLHELCLIPVQSFTAEDALLFLWATAPKLEEALRVLKEWGFKYRTCAVWVKDKIGMGYYFRQRHELLLVGTKGKAPIPSEAGVGDSVFESPRKGHSEKPKTVQDRIELMYPNATRLEMFSRRARSGWSSWGNES